MNKKANKGKIRNQKRGSSEAIKGMSIRSTAQLGHVLQQIRKEKHLSQETLAQRAALSQPTVSDIENGKVSYTASVFKILAALSIEIQLAAIAQGERVFNPEEFYRG